MRIEIRIRKGYCARLIGVDLRDDRMTRWPARTVELGIGFKWRVVIYLLDDVPGAGPSGTMAHG